MFIYYYATSSSVFYLYNIIWIIQNLFYSNICIYKQSKKNVFEALLKSY